MGEVVEDINNVTLVARLTAKPEIKGSVLPLRLAFTTRQKSGDQWEDRSNYVDAVVFGRNADALYGMLDKGTRVVVAGSLEWREWTASDGSTRSRVQVIARSVQIVDGGTKREPALAAVSTGTGSDDIPF
jgi:single-strand DNA-binding protein